MLGTKFQEFTLNFGLRGKDEQKINENHAVTQIIVSRFQK